MILQEQSKQKFSRSAYKLPEDIWEEPADRQDT